MDHVLVREEEGKQDWYFFAQSSSRQSPSQMQACYHSHLSRHFRMCLDKWKLLMTAFARLLS